MHGCQQPSETRVQVPAGLNTSGSCCFVLQMGEGGRGCTWQDQGSVFQTLQGAQGGLQGQEGRWSRGRGRGVVGVLLQIQFLGFGGLSVEF